MGTAFTHRAATVAATSICLLTVGTAIARQNQEPKTPPSDPSSRSREVDDQDLQPLRRAYQNLHEAALRALQAGAQEWRSTMPSTEGSTEPKGSTGGSSQSVHLRSDEILIAACSEGLLAGAPAFGMGSARNPRPISTDDEGQADLDLARRDSTMPNSGSSPSSEPVGMILVCAHSVNAGHGQATEESSLESPRPQEASTGQHDRNRASTAHRSSGGSRLQPGVYAVKTSADTVQLTDKSGQVVLTARLHGDVHGSRPDEASTPPRDRVKPQRVPEGRPDQAGGESQNWEFIFGAITKEAITSMGWTRADKSSSASR
jgi:hypothetical protein